MAPLVTKRLVFTGPEGNHVRVSNFNDHHWKPPLAAAGIIPTREAGSRYASAPEHGMHALRHFYASVLLDAGEKIRALSQYLGHSDPGFTLRTYTHRHAFQLLRPGQPTVQSTALSQFVHWSIPPPPNAWSVPGPPSR